jgi:hypothetical protein
MAGSRERAGYILLEPLIALVVVVVAGLTALSAVAELRNTSLAYERRERETATASAFLDAVSLWPSTELNRRLGEHAQGPFLLTIARPHELVYTVNLSERLTRKQLLWTALYRAREATNAQ